MIAGPVYPRFVEPRLVEALADTPVVLIHGPRQCGKTTLAQVVGTRRDYAYFSFDDDVTLAAARADPVGFVGELPERTILDEAQRVPGIFAALKSASATCGAWRGSDRSMRCTGWSRWLPARRHA